MALEKEAKGFWRKFWFLLWKDDSLMGWIFSLIFLFVFIKLIFFPGLSLVTGTSLPLAIVESCSMYHDGNLFSNQDTWWADHENKYSSYIINNLDFDSFTMKHGFNKGDILFIIKANPEKLKQGDIIIFNVNQKNPVIHRIMEIKDTPSGKLFSTIGDNNNGQLSFEQDITENQIVGKAVVKVAPYFGWVKLIFYDWQKPASERGFCDEN
ncbi:MAG: signal peptidase I [Candidatus Pacearchaeota archaeon]|nr:signal peptidase I [Candidatus Pacearchaeota archaeon]